MKSNLTTCFWGSPDPAQTLSQIRTLIAPFGEPGSYAGDNLITFGRNLAFLSDEAFLAAFHDTVGFSNDVAYGIMWRLYMFTWAAQSCLRRDGDFVECGVSHATSSRIMCRYLNFGAVPKRLFLYDSWGTDPRVPSSPYAIDGDTLGFVRQNFAPYPNVVIVPGFIPDSFAEASPERIAFLHVDLNHAEAELAALDALFDRVVPGGLVLFDDFGANGYHASQTAEMAWCAARGYTIAELPTGQGLLVK